MNYIPVIVGGAAKESKPSVIIGGVEKKIAEAYVIVGGAAKLFYKSAVEWTYTAYNEDGGVTSGNSEIYAADIHIAANHYFRTGSITYFFTEPLYLPQNSTIEWSGYEVDGINSTRYLIINGATVGTNTGFETTPVTSTITISSGQSINTIEVAGRSGTSDEQVMLFKVKINPVGEDSFFLNSTGVSN